MTDTHRGDESSSDAPVDGPVDAPVATDAPVPADRAVPADRQPAPAPAPGPVGGRPVPQPHLAETPTYVTSGLRLALVAAVVVAFGLRVGWIPLGVIAGVLVMITLHELGHYLTAKWSGMKVTEFFIGFGPRIWSTQRGETEYGIKALPVGAYVRIIGMNNLDESDPADEARTYRQQSFPKRLLVVSAGSIMHFVQAFVLLVIALGIVGVPGGSVVDPDERAESWTVGTVNDDSAAAEAGLKPDDLIVAVNGEPVSSFDGGLPSVIRSYDVGDDISFTVERDGGRRTVDAELQERPADVPGGAPGSAFLGVSSNENLPSEPLGLGRAIVAAPEELVRFSGSSISALASFFSPDGIGDFATNVSRASNDEQPQAGTSGSSSADDEGEGNRMLSIYGAVRLGATLSENGFVLFLLFFFQINVFIGIFNMLPLPPLDGGHAVVAIYERIRSRAGRRYQADVAKLMPLTYAVVMVLVLLGVTSLYLDIVNPIDL